MTAYVLHRVGQSIYDLCLQAYGTLDLLVKFCNDNNVTDLTAIPQQVEYAYDTTLVRFEGNPNIYTTDLIREPEPPPTPVSMRVILYPVMEAAPTAPIVAPGTSGFYSFTWSSVPSSFICYYGLAASYTTFNSLLYIRQNAWFLGGTGASQTMIGTPPQTDMEVSWDIPYGSPTSRMLVYSDATVFETLAFQDVDSSPQASFSPLMILDTTAQTILNFLIAGIDAEYVGQTGSMAVIRLTRSHASFSNVDISSHAMSWIGTGGGYPDPLDPTNPDKIMLNLLVGKTTVGVSTTYSRLALPHNFPQSRITMVLEIYE